MAGVRHILTAWLSGEISPYLFGRTETEQYRYGLALCENWLPTIEGPLVKRPGFAMIREADASSSWLGAFRRSVTEEYVIEWGEAKARFFTNGGRIETSPGVAYEIATPYTAAQAPFLSTQQNFDRLYIAHGVHALGALRRDSAITFAHETLTLVDGPFADPNSDQTLTLTASGATGIVTLTASAPLFDPGHVGSPIRLEAADFGDVPAWEAGMDAVGAGSLCYNEGKVYQAATAGKTGQVQPTHTEGSYYDGQLLNDVLNAKGPYGVKWTYLHDRFGMLKITGVTSSTVATAEVTRRLPDTVVTVPTWRWSIGAFSDAVGHPNLVTIWKGRLIAFKDFDIHGSVVGDYGGGRVNFASFSELGTAEVDLAFRRRIAIENPPLWLAKDRKLIIGTADRELAIGPVNSSLALAGSNIEADDQSFYGSEPITPVQTGTETIFVQRGGQRIRSADYDFARDRYDASDLTAAAGHITQPGIVQLAHQRYPYALIHGVREDGQIVVHPKSRLEIRGFARFVLGGEARCKSAVSIIGADGRTEELWLLIERPAADGSTLREIWKQEPWRAIGEDQAQQFYVDGGVRIAAAADQSTFTGLTHLAGQDVAVLADGGVINGMAVDGAGVLTLPAAKLPSGRPFTVIVGLPYTATAIGLSPEFNLPNSPSSQGLIKRLVKVTLRLLESVSISVGTPNGPLEPIVDRPASAAMDAPVPLATGDYGGLVEGEHDTSGVPRWVSADPVAGVVQAAFLKLDVDTRDV